VNLHDDISISHSELTAAHNENRVVGQELIKTEEAIRTRNFEELSLKLDDHHKNLHAQFNVERVGKRALELNIKDSCAKFEDKLAAIELRVDAALLQLRESLSHESSEQGAQLAAVRLCLHDEGATRARECQELFAKLDDQRVLQEKLIVAHANLMKLQDELKLSGLFAALHWKIENTEDSLEASSHAGQELVVSEVLRSKRQQESHLGEGQSTHAGQEHVVSQELRSNNQQESQLTEGQSTHAGQKQVVSEALRSNSQQESRQEQVVSEALTSNNQQESQLTEVQLTHAHHAQVVSEALKWNAQVVSEALRWNNQQETQLTEGQSTDTRDLNQLEELLEHECTKLKAAEQIRDLDKLVNSLTLSFGKR